MITIRPNQIAATLLLASLATSAYFFAQGTTSLIAAKLFGIDDTEEANASRNGARRRGTSPTPTRRAVSANAILERNIFEPPAPAGDGGVQETAAAATVVIDLETQNAPPCATELRVLGAVINPTVPTWSYAALAQGQTPAILHRIGQPFAGKTVYRIDSGVDPESPPLPGGQQRPRVRVVLQEPAGNYCQITMFQTAQAGAAAATTANAATAAPQATPPAAPAAAAAAAAGGDISSTELDQGIVRVSDSQYTVQRSLMERALAQQDALFRSARLIPNEANGAVNGMKVYGIRRTSILGRLGIQNGDVLSNVNGQTMESADALVQAYQLLGRSGTFTINVVRRGQPVALTYQVQ